METPYPIAAPTSITLPNTFRPVLNKGLHQCFHVNETLLPLL